MKQHKKTMKMHNKALDQPKKAIKQQKKAMKQHKKAMKQHKKAMKQHKKAMTTLILFSEYMKKSDNSSNFRKIQFKFAVECPCRLPGPILGRRRSFFHANLQSADRVVPALVVARFALVHMYFQLS